MPLYFYYYKVKMMNIEQKRTFAEVLKGNNKIQQSISNLANQTAQTKQTDKTEQTEQTEELVPIVLNYCFGGFGVSDKAIRRYLELKGLPFIEKVGNYGDSTFYINEDNVFDQLVCRNCDATIHYCNCVSQCISCTIYDDLHTLKCTCTPNKCGYYINCHCTKKYFFGERDFKRTDLLLVQVIKELGEEANGMCAKLHIEYLPKGTKYRINEYDGSESIETEHDIRWTIA